MLRFVVRRLRAEDYAAVVLLFDGLDALHQERLPWLFRSPEQPPRPPEYFTSLLEGDSAAAFVVVADDASIAGVVLGCVRDAAAFALYRPQRFAVLEALVVSAEKRRQGMGRELTQALQAWAYERGAAWLELGVYAFNHAAQRFYRSLGFEPLSTKMRKPLAASAPLSGAAPLGVHAEPWIEPAPATLVGRSSSHFTRLARMLAVELEVAHEFEIVHDLLSLNASDYAGNPALRLPILRRDGHVWFGALNIARELARTARRPLHVVWPEDLAVPDLANAQEIATQAMASEVNWVMAQLGGASSAPHVEKLQRSVLNSLTWLDRRLPELLRALPQQRDLSWLELSVFCLVTHLQFRDLVPTAAYVNLTAFCADFGVRASAVATAYRFDAPKAATP